MTSRDEQEWAEFAEQVRSWRHVDAGTAEHAGFVASARAGGQSSFQAAVGWALVRHNAANATVAGRFRRPPGRHIHHGRVTIAGRSAAGKPGPPKRTSRRFALVRAQAQRRHIPTTHAEIRRAEQLRAVAAQRRRAA